MRTLLCALALAFSVPAFADTLVVVHPSWQETYTGQFEQLNMTETSGGLEFAVDDYAAVKQKSVLGGAKTIWHVGLWIDGSYDYSQAACRGAFSWNYGDPVLTLECPY
jgi:hypothetical protein